MLEQKAYGLSSKLYDSTEIDKFITSIESCALDYEKDNEAFSLSDFKERIEKAFNKAIGKSLAEKDIFLCIKIFEEYAILNINKNNPSINYRPDDISCFEPRVEIICDERLLKGLLSRRYHWNNAEVGSLYQINRVPDVYMREVFSFLNFLRK